MAQNIKDKLEDAGRKISETATRVGHAVSERAEEAADWAKERAHQAGNRIEEAAQKIKHSHDARGSQIKEHMEVYASCGTLVGKVDHVEGSVIKLTKNDSPDGYHHLIPVSWVDTVDDSVHLDRDHREVLSEWQPA